MESEWANENERSESKVFATERKMKELTTWLSMKTNARQSAAGKANHPSHPTNNIEENRIQKTKNEKGTKDWKLAVEKLLCTFWEANFKKLKPTSKKGSLPVPYG